MSVLHGDGRKILSLPLAAMILLMPVYQMIQQERQRQYWQSEQEWPIREAVFREQIRRSPAQPENSIAQKSPSHVFREQIRRSPAQRYSLTVLRSARLINPHWLARVLVVVDPDAGMIARLRADRLPRQPRLWG